MPQYAVYANENSGSAEEIPFLVDVQPDMFDELGTRVVIPLAKTAELTGFPMLYLAPVVAFHGKSYALLTPQLAGILREELGPRAGSLADQERVISAALEFLLRGF
jgi:toxin CcdB